MIPVFDGHNDALTAEGHERLATGRDGGHLDIPRMRAGGVRGGMFAVFTSSPGAEDWEPVTRPDGSVAIKPAGTVAHPIAAADAPVVAGRLFALERAGAVRVARSTADLDAAIADPDSPPAAVLHIEGAEAIDPALGALETWYAAGLRSLGPVWSRPNQFGHGVPFVFPSSPDTGPGLTARGAALVRRCAELGILVDLSHLNEAGFWDVARIEPGPLVATHSGAHARSSCSRNLTDAQLDAIGASDGLVGVVFAVPFVREDFSRDEDTPLSAITAHARYIADRIGVQHVALGSDFDGAEIPHAVGDVAGMPRVLEALGDEGFSDAEIRAIAWDNWRRVLGAWWR
jgi:membrane dipeptidase